jgi:adenylate cyclase class IV
LTDLQITYEVEIRCRFQNTAEAYQVLPFLKASLDREIDWVTRHYGLELFRAGQLLRMSEVIRDGRLGYFLGWKGEDTGTTANIREEIEEEITSGNNNSGVMKKIGGNYKITVPAAARQELERLGHREFMAFHGHNLLGYDRAQDIATKLMKCPDLSVPCLVELEKTAATPNEAVKRQTELRKLVRKYKLGKRLIREEPPTLLYNQQFNKSTAG